MKLIRLIGILAASLMVLTACGQATQSPTPADGNNASDPQRIVVLDLGSLDTLQALGLSDRVVGIPKGGVIPESLSAFKKDEVADVGTLKEPNIEQIAQLKPDLVIAGFRSQAVVPELEKHFKVLDVTYDQKQPFFDGAAEAARKIGEAVGKSDEVEKKLDAFKAKLDEAKQSMPDGATALVILSSGGKLNAMATEGRYALVYNDLGFKPAIENVKPGGHGDPISFEGIQKANPDYLFVVDRDAAIGETGGEAAEKILDNALIHQTKAWQDKHVVYLDGSRWYLLIHGLDNMDNMLKDVADNL